MSAALCILAIALLALMVIWLVLWQCDTGFGDWPYVSMVWTGVLGFGVAIALAILVLVHVGVSS